MNDPWISVDIDGETVVAHYQGEPSEDPKTRDAIVAVVKAAHALLESERDLCDNSQEDQKSSEVISKPLLDPFEIGEAGNITKANDSRERGA